MEDFAGCPVCDKEFPIWGFNGVVVHLLADHADTREARWIVQQAGEIALLGSSR